ncbi:MAG: hypothetical protein QW275_02080 [Candidatus Anstonellaceae archaeon]
MEILARGQAAAEMLILAAFALVFIVPLALLFLSMSENELGKTSVYQAKISARTIADEAGEVYLQGPGAKKTIIVNYPNGVLNGTVDKGLVVLSLDVDGRRTDVVSSTFANITGNLSGRRSAGVQKIDLFYNYTLNAVVIKYG